MTESPESASLECLEIIFVGLIRNILSEYINMKKNMENIFILSFQLISHVDNGFIRNTENFSKNKLLK